MRGGGGGEGGGGMVGEKCKCKRHMVDSRRGFQSAGTEAAEEDRSRGLGELEGFKAMIRSD